MGKRKLHGITYYQCDWSGLPMRATNCYMPTWSGQKLVKHGSYANWECVVAHAAHMFEESEIDLQQYQWITEHVQAICGAPVKEAPKFTELEWFAKEWHPNLVSDASAFHKVCCEEDRPVVAVRVTAAGDAFEILTAPKDAPFQAFLTTPYASHGTDTPGLVEPVYMQLAKKKASKEYDRVMYYWPFMNGLPMNTVASKLFGFNIYGDVVIVKQSKEASMMPRLRFINFTMQDYNELFPKRKRADPTYSTSDYAALKEEMKEQLASVEHAASSLSQKPEELAQASVCPPPSGVELAALADPTGQKRAEQKAAKLSHRLQAAQVSSAVGPPPRRVEVQVA